MGSCMSESQLGPNSNGSRLNSYNPIKIVQEFSIEKLRERWDSAQLKQVETNLISLDRKQIKFEEFIRIFPKLSKFSSKTQNKIYELFAYEGNRALSKQELITSLTLIRKVNQNADFAPFIFYIYSRDPRHEQMTKEQLDEFQKQNKKFYHEEILSYESGANIQDTEKISERNGSAVNLDDKVKKEGRAIHLEQFKNIFEKYNLSLYQQVFGWDLLSEEKELVTKLSKEGIVRRHGDKVFVLEYQWFREWKAYAERKYKVQIQIKEIEGPELNYVSNMSKRKSRNSGYLYQSNRSGQKGRESVKIEKPGQIKNYILKSGKNDNQLVENLVQLNNYICVPEEVWSKLVAIYHGGPAIQRIYPQIYYNTVLHVEVDSDGKFLTKKPVKYTNKDKNTVGEFQRSTETHSLCYYKYPGRYNWTYLQNLRAESKDIFNCPRTYLVFVPHDAAENFQASYNIHENRKGQRCLRKRLKNYGAEINVSIDGVLTKAQVVQIGQEEEIVVEFIGENGLIIRQTIKVDDKLKNLNPENLSSENQLNQLSGLTNIGNTCYMNAVLQCLIRTPSFGGYLEKQNFADKKEGEELVLEQISKIYMESKSNSHETVSTKSFKRIFDKHCPFFEGNSQHDAQEFLICFLSRISEQIKSKRTEYGLKQVKIEKEEEQKQTVNKKVVKFFSGQTEAITECLKCHTKGVRKEPFFTYSLSLPDPDLEYTYFLIENHANAKSTVPTRHGITLNRRVTIEQFIKAICKQHNKEENSMALFTVFNNEILNRLEPYSFQKEIGHHLNFNTRLVCYELKHLCSPSYENFRKREFDECSIKIELRQRIYSEKTMDYKVIYLPYLLEVNQRMFWKDVKAAISSIISKLKRKEPELNGRDLLEDTPFRRSDIHNSAVRESQIVILEEMSNIKESTSHVISTKGREGVKKTTVKESFSLNPNLPSQVNVIDNYKIRVIKSDHYKQNFCVFCKDQFILNRFSRSTKTCKGCGFDEQTELFKNINFRNIYDNIIIAIDWEGGIPDFEPFVNDRSYELSEARMLGRHDKLEDLLIKNLSNKETLELRCEKETCRYQYAQRYERILVAPNILLLHLKRFTYEDNMLFKLTNNVLYPLELTLPGSKERYELYGAVAHIGSGVGGHYISYVRVMQRWYKCDDSRVTLAAEGQEIDCNAYLLFYKRVDFEPSLMCLSF